jgi:hypothetical protein
LTDVTEQTFRIFLQWVQAQLRPSGSQVRIPGPHVLRRTLPCPTEDVRIRVVETPMDKAFDEEGYRIHPLIDEDREKFFYKDEYWCKNYQMSIVSYLKLYIFADKYSVHQLRDDTITAILGQSHY